MRLIDADALKANVPDTSADIFENCRNCKTLMDWQVKELIDQQPTVSPWHRVEDELPDLLQFVVVCNDEGKCVVAQYVGYQTDSITPWRIAYTMYDTDIFDEKDCGPVRYWMPIEPPKEDE
jgi:hypothetical protein